MYRRFVYVVLIMLFVSVSSSFAADPTSSAPQPQNKPGVVATVNGSEISLDDFTRELYSAQRLVLGNGRLLTAPRVTRLRTEVLESLIRYELLYQESKKTVKVTDTEIAQELERLKTQIQSETDFTYASPLLRVQAQRALSDRKYRDTKAAQAHVTDR